MTAKPTKRRFPEEEVKAAPAAGGDARRPEGGHTVTGKPRGARYTEDERRIAMRIHAAASGRRDIVEEMLRAEGLTMGVRTVTHWVSRFPDEYDSIQNEHRAYVRSKAEEEIRGVTTLALEVVGESLRQSRDALARGEIAPKDLPATAKAGMVSVGISVDKSELLSGNPTQITRGADTEDLKRELASVGITVILPGSEDRTPAALDVQAREAPAGLPEHVGREDADDAR